MKVLGSQIWNRFTLGAQTVKIPPAMQETWVWFLGWDDPCGGGNGYLLQHFCLENSLDRGASLGIVHGVAESDVTEWLTLLTHLFENTPQIEVNED